MKFIADFHIHSHYSRATSKDLVPENLDYQAGIKGIKVMGTGDFTHPGWLKELKEKLIPAEDGLFKLKNEYRLRDNVNLNPENETRFILSAEISNIYKKNDKVRKVHCLILSPDFETAENIQKRLEKSKFNITSDGRPILGLDAKTLLEITLEISENILFIPAHIWTPWFSVLGEKSGFDSIEECFEDLSKYIFALETGLSSDPPMNYLCSFLDKYRLISNSDAHSPEKIGRNANLFDTDMSYNSITNAIRLNNGEFKGTIDMFPQEGKYHYDGHRNCGVVCDPLETLKNNYNCPKCGKRLTIGVMHRVTLLSDRNSIEEKKDRTPNHYIIPLKEILSEIIGSGESSIGVTNKYNSLINKFDNEFNLLLFKPLDEIKESKDMQVYEAIKRMRAGDVFIEEGYDGEYGKILLFDNKEEMNLSDAGLFGGIENSFKNKTAKRDIMNFDLKEYHCLLKHHSDNESNKIIIKDLLNSRINEEQYKAINHFSGPLLILAGPGTGKTYSLANRVVNLIMNKKINPQNILAITFTNKASDEMKSRLNKLLNNMPIMPQICTFHSFGYSILKKYFFLEGRNENFTILNDDDRSYIINEFLKNNDTGKILKFISDKKNNTGQYNIENENELTIIFNEYEKYLENFNCFDLDDLIYKPNCLFGTYPEITNEYREQYKWVFIDEYQDINSSQYKLLRYLCNTNDSNICAIGDPNQSIYSFRGSEVKFISQFITDYPSAAVYKLNRSYRCSDKILKAGDNIIDTDNSIKGIGKGVKINISEHSTSKSEAEFIARTIESMIGGLGFFSMDSNITRGNNEAGIKSLSDFSILCRIKEQFKDIEKALNDHHIPYKKFSENRIMENNIISGIIDLLKYINNPNDKFLEHKIKKNHRISDCAPISNSKTVKETLTFIIENCLRDIMDNEVNYYIERLIELSDQFGNDVQSFLRFINTGAEPDMIDMKSENVKLMTIHASKGLEFEAVFIPGCEEGIIPFSFFDETINIEEEKRILYVGFTRSKKYLYISNANKRKLYGRDVKLRRSGFIDKIEKDLYILKKSDYDKKKNDQPDLF